MGATHEKKTLRKEAEKKKIGKHKTTRPTTTTIAVRDDSAAPLSPKSPHGLFGVCLRASLH